MQQKIKQVADVVTKDYCALCQKAHTDALKALQDKINSNFVISTTLVLLFISGLGLLMGFHII